MKGWLAVLPGALSAIAVHAASWDLSQLMDELARMPKGRARFVETKYVALLDKPLVSSGELSFTAPDRLEKRTLTPRPERLLLEQDKLSIERDKKTIRISLGSQPAALAFVESIRGALTGNRQALERNYSLHLSGSRDQWTLVLLPSEQALAAFVQKITLTGQRSQVRSIEYLQTDGDRALMRIEPLAEP